MSFLSGSSSPSELADTLGQSESPRRQACSTNPPGAPYMGTVPLPVISTAPPPSPALPMQSLPHPESTSSPSVSSPAQHSSPGHPFREFSGFPFVLPCPLMHVFYQAGQSISTSPRFTSMSIHPLLRPRFDQLTPSTVSYNILYAPSLFGPRPLTATPALTEHRLGEGAFTPTFSSLDIHLFFHLDNVTLQLPWTVSTRTHGHAIPLTVFDVLCSLHLSLAHPVDEQELARLPLRQLDSAQAMRARRMQLFGSTNTSVSIVRSDFLCYCTNFAGILRTFDASFVVRLTS